MYDLVSLGKSAKKAAAALIKLSDEVRNNALISVAKALRDNKEYLIKENLEDI